MPPKKLLKLNCSWIDDENPNDNVLSVDISKHETVGDLKKAIKNDAQVTFAGIDAHRLRLSKVSIPMGDLSREKIQEDLDKEQLHPLQPLDEIFAAAPDPKSVHVLVKVQHTIKRAHSPYSSAVDKRKRTDVDPGDAWLSELHSKIWGRNDLRPQLVYNIEITAAHYVELQRRLTDLYPSRNSPDYVAQDVLAIKLNILQSFVPPSSHLAPAAPPDDEQPGVENDEDNQVDEFLQFFPITIRYLDLSSLGLEEKSFRFPLPLLIRQEYDFINGLLNKGFSASAIVSGQPGTGKTAYLYSQIIEYMIMRRPFLYQTTNRDVYHISDTVVPIASWTHKATIVAFVDADSTSCTPEPFLINPLIQLVLVSSPKGAKQKWLKQIPNGSPVMKYASALWTPSEFFVTGAFLHPFDLTYARLKESASYFGFNPRHCFNTSLSASILLQLQDDIKEEIRAISPTTPIASILAETRNTSGLSHLIFELSPADENRHLSGARIGAVSNWALDLLLKEYEKRQATAAADFYFSLLGTPTVAPLCGRIMERQVLKYFDSLKGIQGFKIRALNGSIISDWNYPGPAKRVTFQAQSFAPSLESAVGSKQSLHLVPLDPNFPAINSVLYNPSEVLSGIQVTISDRHPVVVSGLKRIQSWLKVDGLLAHLRPSTLSNHWRLIFVVPNEMAATFHQQPLEGDTGGQEWAGKVDQYVLGIPEDTLWGRAAKT